MPDHAPTHQRPPRPPSVALRHTDVLIPGHVLVASGAFAPRLGAAAVAAAIARGLEAGGLAEADLLALPDAAQRAGDVRELLHAVGFDARMRSARAVIVAVRSLHERTLTGSPTFEIATRARQAGVPAYAVTAENGLDCFDARMLDLQVILEAGSARALTAAGTRLAELI